MTNSLEVFYGYHAIISGVLSKTVSIFMVAAEAKISGTGTGTGYSFTVPAEPTLTPAVGVTWSKTPPIGPGVMILECHS